jgi:hypothetical protein
MGQQQVHLLQQDSHLSKFPFKRMRTRCNTETPSEGTNQYSNPFQQKASMESCANEQNLTVKILDDSTQQYSNSFQQKTLTESCANEQKLTVKILDDSTQ